MKYLSLMFCLVLPLFLLGEEDSVFLSNKNIAVIKNSAETGDANCQLIMGILLELGYGLPQDTEMAAEWYWLSAQQGNSRAQNRLESLRFSDNEFPNDRIVGIALVLLKNSEPRESQEEFGFRSLTVLNDLKSDQPVNWRSTKSWNQILLISDRPDPSDDNERVYGPGTWEGNAGILRSEFERLEREHKEFISQLDNLKIQAESMKMDSIREKIEILQGKHGQLYRDAWRDLVAAVGEALGAGLFLEYPVIAVIAAYESVENFKSFVDRCYEVIDVKKEVENLLKMERSLEKDREKFGRER